MALLRGLMERNQRAQGRRHKRAQANEARLSNLPLKPNFIKDVLDAADRRAEPARIPGVEEYIHVSSLIAYCERLDALSRQNTMPIVRSVTGGHKVMWQIGRAVERHIRDTFIRARNGQGVLGEWKCKCEATSIKGLLPVDPAPCTRCRTLPMNYHEVGVADHEAKIIGNPDLPVITRDRRVVVVEIKSMKSSQFDALTEPLHDHVFQALSYRKLFTLNEYEVEDHAIILYCTKDFKFGSPYKEYHVGPESHPQIQAEIDNTWDRVKAARSLMESGQLPPRLHCCTSVSGSFPKACPLSTMCFIRSA